MKYIILVMLILSFNKLAFAESYLCTANMQTGFVFQETTNTWVQTNMKGTQFLLKPLKQADKKGDEDYGVYEVTGGTLLFRCQYWFEDVGVAHCGNENDYHFKFRRGKDGTGKFVSADLGVGYFLNDKTSAPRIGIGSCIRVE